MFPNAGPGGEKQHILNPENVLSLYHAVIDGAPRKSTYWAFDFTHDVMTF
jgi:hypothetical protein